MWPVANYRGGGCLGWNIPTENYAGEGQRRKERYSVHSERRRFMGGMALHSHRRWLS